jgi:ABC-type Fe3+ transport system permease subunit
MQSASNADRLFLEHRRARRNTGLVVLPAVLAGLLALWVALFLLWPISVNPFTVVGRIEQQLFEPGTLTMYAVTATVLMNVLFLLLAIGIALAMVWARTERRYLKLLEQRDRASETAKSELPKGV